MKKITFLLSWLLISLLIVEAKAIDPPSKKKRNEQMTVWFDIKNGGYSFLSFNFLPMKVIGQMNIRETSFSFVPYDSAQTVDLGKRYQYNHLIKEIVIPYSEIKSVNKWFGFTIKTKDGRRFHFTINFPKKTIREIRSHV